MAGKKWAKVVALGRAAASAINGTIRLNARAADDLPAMPLRLRWLNLALILLTFATMAAAYNEGLRQNMHRVAPDAMEMLAETIAVDISQRYHGTHGYVGRSEVLDTLLKGGFTGQQRYLDPFNLTYPENGEKPDLINRAISDALALKLPPGATFGNQRLFAPYANDPGFVDYISLGFDLFGWNVEAFYYLYFLVLTVSVVLFIVSYHADALPLLALTAAMVALLTLMNSSLFGSVNLRTVHNQRFLGSLCLVPYLHLLFAMLIYRRLQWLRGISTVLQAVLLTFLIFARSSGFWMILSFAAVIGVNAYFTLGRAHLEASLLRMTRLALSWPSLLVVSGLLISLAYKSAVLHPIYSLGIFIPHHMVWHNAYIGLGLHPDWNERGDKHNGKPIPTPLTDNMAYQAAVAEAETYYGLSEANLNNSDIGGFPAPKMRLHEQLTRDRFLRFAIQNPRFILETYFWYKPKTFFEQFALSFQNYRWNLWTIACQVIFLGLGVAMYRWATIPADVRKTIGAGLLVTGVMSLIPIEWTYPLRNVAGEQFLMWITIGLYFAAWGLAIVWSRARPLILRQA